MPSWEELERPKRPEPKADEFAILCSQTFSSGSGARLLAMFRQMTIEKTLPESATEKQLADLETQRRFVRRIETAMAAGLPKPKAKT